MTHSFIRHTAAACSLLVAGALGAQDAATAATGASSGGPKVGEVAPNFALPGATKLGPSQTPVKLSDLQGQTVIIAFFPRARTGG